MVDFLQGLLTHWGTPLDIKIYYRSSDGYPDVLDLAESTVATWRKHHTRFLVLCDQDNADCKERKQRIIERIAVARRGAVDVRIVCRQLETWYLGDLAALVAARPKLAAFARSSAVRGQPDLIVAPAKLIEAQLAEGRLRKRALARDVGLHARTHASRSHSFNVFVDKLREILGAGDPDAD